MIFYFCPQASEVMTQLTESVSLSAIRKEPSLSDIERNQSALTTVKGKEIIKILYEHNYINNR